MRIEHWAHTHVEVDVLQWSKKHVWQYNFCQHCNTCTPWRIKSISQFRVSLNGGWLDAIVLFEHEFIWHDEGNDNSLQISALCTLKDTFNKNYSLTKPHHLCRKRRLFLLWIICEPSLQTLIPDKFGQIEAIICKIEKPTTSQQWALWYSFCLEWRETMNIEHEWMDEKKKTVGWEHRINKMKKLSRRVDGGASGLKPTARFHFLHT